MNSQSKLFDLLTRSLGERPLEIEEMTGATSSDLYTVLFADRQLVVRLFKEEKWQTDAAILSEREAVILTALSGADLPTPAPITTLAGNGVVMSWLPGSVILPRHPDRAWIDGLAAALGRIHRSSIELPYHYESWNDVGDDPAPDWWVDRELWSRIQSIAGDQPTFQPSFIHRDYHPVNVLWRDSQISGIVDWINACMGPVGIDVAHCRLNLALMYGMDAADRFLRAYEGNREDYAHDSYWDIDDALGMLPNTEPYTPWSTFGLSGLSSELVQDRLQRFLLSAVTSRSC